MEVLKLKDVVRILRMGEKTIYAMMKSGELPAFKVRGQWRVSQTDLDAWIEQQKRAESKN